MVAIKRNVIKAARESGLYEELKRWRKANGYTIEDIQHKIGFTNTGICNFEKGWASPESKIGKAYIELYRKEITG